MKKKLAVIWFLSISIVSLALASIASATTILNFEDLRPVDENRKHYEAYGYIPDDYAGFDWGYNGGAGWITSRANLIGPGYENGTIGKVSLFTRYAMPINLSSTTKFNLKSAFITSAWNPTSLVDITGWDGLEKKYQKEIMVGIELSAPVSFDWSGLTRVTFAPAIGDCFGHIVLDNIHINEPVPEPATLLLLGTGIAGLVASRRKKATKQ